MEKGFHDFKGWQFNKSNRCAISWNGQNTPHSFGDLWEAGDSLLVIVNMEERSFTVTNKKDPSKTAKVLNIPNNRFIVFYDYAAKWTITEQSTE